MFTCPKCNKEQYPVCGKPDCVCRQRIPRGEKPQIDRPMLRRLVIPRGLFNWLWHTLKRPPRWGLHELLECPYCGYRNTHDYWFEREIEQAEAAGLLP